MGNSGFVVPIPSTTPEVANKPTGGACIGSALLSYTRGHVRVLFLVSAAIMTAFTGALALSTPENPVYTVTIATFAAFGNGALVVPALTLALYGETHLSNAPLRPPD